MKKFFIILLVALLTFSGCASNSALTKEEYKEQLQVCTNNYVSISGSIVDKLDGKDILSAEKICNDAKAELDKIAALVPPSEISDAHEALKKGIEEEKSYIDKMQIFIKAVSKDENSAEAETAANDMNAALDESTFSQALLNLYKQLK